jgi:flagellar assembly protein FliH
VETINLSDNDALILDAKGQHNPRLEPKDFKLEEMEPGQPRQEAPAEEEEGGFRLLVYGGRQEDPRDRAERQAAEIMEKAEQDSTALVEEATGQAEGIRNQAYEEGYQQGHEEGLNAAKALVQAAADNLSRALAKLDQARAEVMNGLEGEIIGLVQAVCDQIFATPDAVPDGVIKQVVREAVGRLLEYERVTVRLSQKDMSTIEEFRPELLKTFTELGRLNLLPDPDLSPGECLVETPNARVDATLDTRRQRVFKALVETLKGNEPLDLNPVLEAKEQAPPQESPADEIPSTDPSAEPAAGGPPENEEW